MRNAYANQYLERTVYNDWFNRFKDGRISVDDNPRSGRPSTSIDDAHMIKFNGIVCFNKNVNYHYYHEVLKYFRKKLRMKRPEVWKENSHGSSVSIWDF